MAERSGRKNGLSRETLKDGLDSPTRLGALTAILIVLVAGVVAVITHAPATTHRVVATGAPVAPSPPSEAPAAVATTQIPTSTTTETTSAGRQTTTTSRPLHAASAVAATSTQTHGSTTTTATVPPPPACTLSQLSFSMAINGRQYQPSSPPAYLTGDGMVLRTAAVNISAQPCTDDAYPCDAADLVQDAQGASVGDMGPQPDLSSPCPFPTAGKTLAPGMSTGQDVLFDVNPQPPLPAGHYFARSLWLINGVRYTGSPVPLDLRQADDGTRVLTTTPPYPETVS